MTTRNRKLRLLLLLALGVAAGFVGQIVYVWWHIPEAYAAWDTGTLLTRYMQKHDNEWPDDWSDLEQLHSDEPSLRLFWNARQPDYFDRMREMIQIDWTYNPSTRTLRTPVRGADGSELVCLWSDPNGMVHHYLDHLNGINLNDQESNATLIGDEPRMLTEPWSRR
ncbi:MULTISPECIES: hypothetical protein [Rhodopirellula]|uniref:hypothetical protein n=1 Tax=Rhodopirellula TaxID=265488 RepID=UPI00257DB2EE|nr:hypothetical protein [Rhodopirellula sp. UBA1907]